jgi:tetratricopeptide (TPR) repeat protein
VRRHRALTTATNGTNIESFVERGAPNITVRYVRGIVIALREFHQIDGRPLNKSDRPLSPQNIEARGWRLYRAGDYGEALRMFDIVLTSKPDDYSALLGRGRCHRLLGAYDEATTDFTHAHDVRAAAARPLFERGAISMLRGRYDQSLADYEAAAILEPTYPGSASYFAEVYLYTGRADDALAISEQANRDEPTNLVHRVNVAHAHLLLGDTECALHTYAAIADEQDPGKGITGAAIALGDLALMRSAGIHPPGMHRIKQRLRESTPTRP